MSSMLFEQLGGQGQLGSMLFDDAMVMDGNQAAPGGMMCSTDTAASTLGTACGYPESNLEAWLNPPPTAFAFSPKSTICVPYTRVRRSHRRRDRRFPRARRSSSRNARPTETSPARPTVPSQVKLAKCEADGVFSAANEGPFAGKAANHIPTIHCDGTAVTIKVPGSEDEVSRAPAPDETAGSSGPRAATRPIDDRAGRPLA